MSERRRGRGEKKEPRWRVERKMRRVREERGGEREKSIVVGW